MKGVTDEKMKKAIVDGVTRDEDGVKEYVRGLKP